MAERYYVGLENKFPPIVRAILERVNIYFAQLLYPDQATTNLGDTIESRIFVTDVDAGGDNALGDASRFFGVINSPIPFTAYGIGDRELIIEKTNYYAAGGFFFIPELGYAIANPVRMFVPAFSFFSNPDDWNIAFTKLMADSASLTKLDVPIKIAGQDVNVKITLSFDTLNKGSFAGAFVEHLRVNEIWDIQHNIQVLFTDLVFIGSEYGTGTPTGVIRGNPEPQWGVVDDMILSLYGTDGSLNSQEYLKNPPTVLTTSPVNKTTGNAVTSNIVVNFSRPMVMESVRNNFTILPYAEGDFIWDFPGQNLTYKPIANLAANTNYIVTIGKEAKDGYDLQMENDFVFEFKTV